jgi:hypothetical protein
VVLYGKVYFQPPTKRTDHFSNEDAAPLLPYLYLLSTHRHYCVETRER